MNIKTAFFALILLAFGATELCAQQSESEKAWVARRKLEHYKTYWTAIQYLPGEWSEPQIDGKTKLVEKWELVNDSTMTGRRFEMVDGKEQRQIDEYLLEKRNSRLFLTLNPKSEKPVKFRVKEKNGLVFVFENMEKGQQPGIIEISREDRDAIRVAQKTSAEVEECVSHIFRK